MVKQALRRDLGQRIPPQIGSGSVVFENVSARAKEVEIPVLDHVTVFEFDPCVVCAEL